ncbi:tripartite tricarboxylate transporter substrate binding protein [Halalkalibacter okhensis]|uniref:Uncharacterized protein n=1 Tax=Halalkalibacter okhensis TaxID=333138 RepID=A0A0B0IBF4_9BACI|nr:tripartite tricarboxylate transporter substrate binding protein [Halalkalibacter okhensis]KHF38640.1 hypothetical protein LQ50_20210 [Halalkalibacter okhensis]
MKIIHYIKKRNIILLGLVSILLLSLIACSSETGSQGNETNESGNNENGQATANFPEEEIKIIVPYSAGGGFDLAARMLAPYLAKYLPNDATVIVENISGGNGNIGLGELTRAKPDGHTLGVVNLPGHFVQQILEVASYDLTEYEYIGNITKTEYIAAASPSSNFTELSQLQDADEVRAGITNISSTDGLGLVVSADELGINVRTINHPGSTEAILAAIRGDVDIVQLPVESLSTYFESGDLVPLWSYTTERLEQYPDLPTITELGHENLINLVSLYRAIATTPGTPEETLTILREAFEKAVNDEEYIEQVLEAGAFHNPSDYADAAQTAEDSLEMLVPYVDLLKSE